MASSAQAPDYPKRFLAKHYQGSFMAVSAADEVLGRGFKRWRSI
ncbi:hypothetical protein [Synergistes jonesii]|nr:hypothetical protein [Synergistes jonesii]